MNKSNTATKRTAGPQIDARRPLMILALLWGGAIAILLTTQDARAELRCDCTEVVDSCSATVSLEGMQVSIESDSRACSRVDYLIEGQPFAALVVGGSTQINWSGQPMRDPQVVIENCRVCAETGSSTAANSGSSNGQPGPAAKADGPAEAIVKVMPLYPRDAWTNDIEGDVTIEFNVSAEGIVEKIKVVKSSNPVFITTSIDAISRFRYAPAQKDGAPVASQGVREKFQFRIPDGSNPIVTSAAL
jgi:TonB family protein